MVILLMFLALCGIRFDNPAQEKVSLEFSFCNFKLPDSVKVSNASFNVTYSFEVDEDGRPAKISRLFDDYVGEETVSACLASWRFQGTPKGQRMIVNFRWQHGDGWTEVAVSGSRFSQRIKITGERCPYQPVQSPNSKRPTTRQSKKTKPQKQTSEIGRK